MLPIKTFIFLLSACVTLGELTVDRSPPDKDNNGFIFTTPKTMRSGRRETACLFVHGNQTILHANVTVTIESTGPQKVTAVTKKTFDTGCFEIRVPHTTDVRAKIQLQVKLLESNYTINGVDYVHINQNTGITFVQTDRNIYKPGDRVKLRILLLTSDLTVPKNLTVPIVKIRNPSRIAIGQWENVTTELGLVQLEHQLSPETMLGTWTIELPENQGASKTFEVKEYTLPRFEVIIKHAGAVYESAETFNFTVCSKYTYGAPVKGTAHLKVKPFEQTDVNQIKELHNGCADFVFHRTEVKIIPYVGVVLDLTATVTEHGTGQLETASDTVPITSDEYSLLISPDHFQPGIPFNGKVRVAESLKDITNKTMKICYNLAIKHEWNYTRSICEHFNLTGKNETDFVIFPFEENIHSIQITAQIENGRTEYFTVNRWYSPSNSYIQISQDDPNQPIKCKSWHSFTVIYTLNNTSSHPEKNSSIEFNYLIKSKGNIMKTGKMHHVPCDSHTAFRKDEYENTFSNASMLKPKLLLDKFILTVKIHQKIYSEGELLVYYVRNDGEVVGNSIKFDVENCLQNKVESSWTDNQKYPGETTYFNIKAAAGSLCAVSAVDKSTHILSPGLNLNTETLLNQVRKPRPYDYTVHTQCKEDHTIVEEDYLPYWDLRRRKRSSLMRVAPPFYDMFQLFGDMELLVMTDLTVLTRPCVLPSLSYRITMDMEDRDLAAPLAISFPGSYKTQAADTGVPVRSYFPETWLWDLIPVGRSGETQLKRDIPHTITQWIGNTFCVSPSAGVGIASASYITSFKPFFIDILTPYAIKRNEVSHLKVIAFNYLNHSLPVKISLNLNRNLRLAGDPEESSVTACIGPNDSVTNVFRVTALVTGKVNISITAEVDSAYPGECGPEILIHRRDVIVKNVIVHVEGFPFETAKSTFICLNENTTDVEKEMKWNLELSYDAIQDYTRIKILLDADLLELTTENVGSLLKIPNGCGEQIMATLAPNLYVLRYLKALKRLTPDIEEKSLNFIKIGYERILRFRHRDGSFSIFGEQNTKSSMFLTALVMRTLSQASKYVYIDDEVITKAASWIIEQQYENGCFPATSYDFFSSMREHDNDTVVLSAYVLISLLDSGIELPERVRDNAKFCLRGHNSANKYRMAIITYGLTLVGWQSEASRSLDRLLEVASRQNNLIWWEDSESLANSVEMTSYVIMSLVANNNKDHIAIANGAVRWLLTKRNEDGGFISTQDTVVALDALTRYALVSSSEDTNITVTIGTNAKQYIYRITNRSKLKTKQLTLTKFTKFIKFKLEGTGCILVQSTLRYNMPQIISSEALKLAVGVSPVSTIDKCTMAEISPCISYVTPDKYINMAVLEVTLPSGYKADRTSLHNLVKSSESKCKRFEETEDKVILYFSEVDNTKICAPFLIREQNFVENRTNAIVRLYDYYNPGIQASTSYEVEKCLSNDISILPPTQIRPGIHLESPKPMYPQDTTDYQQDGEYMTRNENGIETDSVYKSGQTGLNKDFVDLDINLDFPEGIEGPKPVYVKPPKNRNRNNNS